MAVSWSTIFIAFCALSAADVIFVKIDANKVYDSYKIFDVWAENFVQTSLLQQFYEQFLHMLDFLMTNRSGEHKSLRFLATPEQTAEVEQFLSRSRLKFKIVNANESVELKTFDQNRKRRPRPNVEMRTLLGQSSNDITKDFQDYLRYDDIDNCLNYFAENYPERVKILPLGRSYENRDLKAILITDGLSESNKPLILIDAGAHAREWIAPQVAMYVIQTLVENQKNNARQLGDFDWLIFPLVNPDGYEYSHKKRRLWRKTRKPSGFRSSENCVGTDLNRNFDFKWGVVGASQNPCSGIYQGPRPFSEPETVAVRNLMFSVKRRCLMYLSLHAYGNYVLYPWGYKYSLPETWSYLDAIARAGARAILNATSSIYDVGSSTTILYAASGASDDYAFAEVKIPVSMTMELTDGSDGFNPPPEKIKNLAKEAWIGIRAMADEIADMGGVSSNAGRKLSALSFWNSIFLIRNIFSYSLTYL